jgi:hypothetical protein
MTKHADLQRAKDLLSKGDSSSLLYAALELRRCIEAIVYQKLETYSKYVPGVVFDRWQPAHALKALLQFEPDADEDFRLRVVEEDHSGNPKGPWIDLGEHRTFRVAWLGKNYNKLSSHLHVAHGKQKHMNVDEVRDYLIEVVEAIDRILECSIIGASLGQRIQFKCSICDSSSLVNVQVAERTKRATCINPNCSAVYHVEKHDDQWQVELEATEFKCQKCKASIWLENRHLNVGRLFKCQECQTEHVIFGRNWGYATKEEADRHVS